MDKPKSKEERKEEIFSETEQAITAIFNKDKNKWTSAVYNFLSPLRADIFMKKEDRKISVEQWEDYDLEVREIESFTQDTCDEYPEGVLPPEDLRNRIIKEIVDLQYKLEKFKQ